MRKSLMWAGIAILCISSASFASDNKKMAAGHKMTSAECSARVHKEGTLYHFKRAIEWQSAFQRCMAGQ